MHTSHHISTTCAVPGSTKPKTKKELLKYDVVLTTYNVRTATTQSVCTILIQLMTRPCLLNGPIARRT